MTYIEHIPKPLLDDILQNRCIPIIGAGFSANADVPRGKRMPLWSDLSNHFANQLVAYPQTNPLDIISAFCHEYSRSVVMEQLRDELLIDSAKPGPVHLAFAELPFDTIITTNFDFLSEKAYEQKGKPCYPITDEGW